MVERILKYTLFTIPAVLLFIPDNMFFPFISGKGILFRLLVEVALGLYIYSVIKDKTLLPKKGPLSILISTFALWVLIADLASPIVSKAFWSNFERMEGFVLIGHLWIYFVMLSSVFRSRVDWYKFFYAVLTTAVAMSLFALLQKIGAATINQSGVRLDSLMGNSAYFAGFCLFSVFLSLFLFKKDFDKSRHITLSFFLGSVLFCFVYLTGEQKNHTGNLLASLSFMVSALFYWCSFICKKTADKILSILLFIGFIVLQVYLMFLTQTRGAALGFLGGLFVTSLLIALFEKKGLLKKVAIVLVTLIVSSIAIFISFKDSEFVKDSPILSRFAEISWKNTSGQARQIIWPMAIEGFKERPIVGWGQEGFNYVFAKYYNPELWRHEPWFDRTHNVFLDWLVATGIVGFLLYLSFYVFLFRGFVIVFWKEHKVEFAIWVGLLLAYAFQNLFIFDNLASYILFFAILAFVHSQTVSYQTEEVKKNNHKTQKPELHPLLIACVALGLSVFLSYWCVYKPTMQNRSIIKGMTPQKNITDNLAYFIKAVSFGSGGVGEAREQLMSVTNQVLQIPQLSADIKRGFMASTVDQARLHQQDFSTDSKTLLSLATGFNQNGNPDIALNILGELQKQSPKKQHILMQTAISYLLTNDLIKAESILKETYEITPDYPDAAMLYASVLLDLKKNKEALDILKLFAVKGEKLKPYVMYNLNQKSMKAELGELLEMIYKASPTEENKVFLEQIKSQ